MSLLLVMLELMVVLMAMVKMNLSGAIKRSLVRLENMTSKAGAGRDSMLYTGSLEIGIVQSWHEIMTIQQTDSNSLALSF